MSGLIGKKIGMTRVFAEDGTAIPVTAIEAGPCPVVQVRTPERDGYRAIQLGYGRKKPRRTRRPDSGHAAGAGLEGAPAVLKEFRLGEEDRLADDPHTPATGSAGAAEASGSPAEIADDAGEADEPEGDGSASAEGEEAAAEESAVATASPAEEGYRVGQELTVALFEVGEKVKVTGRTKGRGFQGVVKRHGFGGRPGSHGHPSVRVPGSIGPGTDPSRVMKGRRMAGQMGVERRTVRNLEVVRIDPERNLLFIRGSVPGPRNSLVYVQKQ